MKNKLKALNGFVIAIFFISLFGCGGCGDGGSDKYASFNSVEVMEDTIIEAYHQAHFPS